MTKFGIIMTLEGSPLPPDRQYLAMQAIQQGMEQAGKEVGFKVECKVIPMPDTYDLKDLRDFLIASA